MNLIKVLEELKIDMSITESPVQFLLFQEIFLEDYAPLYQGGYNTIFNKVSLDKYFNNELTLKELLSNADTSKLELPYKDEFFPLICERLEEIKDLPNPIFNSKRNLILEAIITSSNTFISLPYIGVSLHKYELATLLALTEWESWFMSTFGWGHGYTAITFEFKSIFNIGELEIYLPYDEMKRLIDKLPHHHYENLYSDLELTKTDIKEDMEILTRLSSVDV